MTTIICKRLMMLTDVSLLLLMALFTLFGSRPSHAEAPTAKAFQSRAAEGATNQACFSEVLDTPFAPVWQSSVTWADYDNDDDLDLLIAGEDNDVYTTALYRNDNGLFADSQIPLIGVARSTLAWGDYDKDGYLDLIISGENGDSDSILKLYRNADSNGSRTLTEVSTPFDEVRWGSAAWADYDNDGYLDIVISGLSTDTFQAVTLLYRNDNGTFVKQEGDGYTFQGVRNGRMAWADYDGDNDPDLLITGRGTEFFDLVAVLYRNDNGKFTEQTGAGYAFPLLQQNSIAWADYDKDNDPDLLVAGSTSGGDVITKLYRNDNGSFVDSGANLPGFFDGSMAWADYDNDGDLDLFIAGSADGLNHLAKLYRNDAGNLIEQPDAADPAFPGVWNGSVAWGDYNGDGRPDLFLTGSADGNVAKLYRNGPCAGANVFDVADGDVQGLINAINAANAISTQGMARQSSPPVVNLATNGSYTLTAPHNDFGGGNGLPIITGTVTINGNGSTIARSNIGVADFRILAISGTLTLDNVIVSNGHLTGTTYPNWMGGAIFNSGVLSITNSTVQSSTNRFGGGIGNAGTLYIHNSTVQNNRSPDISGGGLLNIGQATIDQSVIRNNVAQSFGGGISNQEGGTVTVTHSTITGNLVAVDDGGGIHNRNSVATVMSSTISMNRAPNIEFGSGGGIFSHGSRGGNASMTIQHSLVISNTAGRTSGGIASGVSLSGTAHMEVHHSTISYNQVTGDPADSNTGFGGGIGNAVSSGTTSGSSILTITHSSIHHNSAVNAGGVGNSLATAAGFVNMRVTVENSAIYSNTATGIGDQRGNGGGIANLDATFTLRNSTVSGNRALSDGSSQTSGLAGGLLNGSFVIPAQLTVENSTIANNQAVAGGGLTNVRLAATTSATSSFQNSIIANNTDLSGFGPNCLNPNLGAGAATLTSNGHNLDSGVTCGFTESSDLANVNPLLGPLADNGGPTWTHALMDNSPAIDAANGSSCPATDQRGVARPVGNGCDMGAYEGGMRTVMFLVYLPLTVK